MQAVRLIIPGNYYDSQIYSGYLYLWTTEGSIVTIDWNSLIGSIEVPERLQLALDCAFLRSDYLYEDYWNGIFQDAEIKAVVIRKFEDLSRSPISVSRSQVHDATVQQHDNSFPFPHADTEIYNNVLYVGDASGVLSSGCSDGGIDQHLARIWDGPALSMRAAHRTLALAAGGDGLFEYRLAHSGGNSPVVHQVLAEHSSLVRWLYAHIFSSSYYNEGFLAEFSWRRVEISEEQDDAWSSILEMIEMPHDEVESPDQNEVRYSRELKSVVPSSLIFGHETRNGKQSLTWGVNEKICLASSDAIEVVQFNPAKRPFTRRYVPLGRLEIAQPSIGDIVSADSGLFGYVLEFDEGLLVVSSSLQHIWLQGEPVNWRLFPRAIYYANQLHVIYEDHLCVYSFNQDYFINQDSKVAGIKHAPPRRNRRR